MSEPAYQNVVYQWDFRPNAYRDASAEEQRLLADFLRAHDIEPMAFVEGNSLCVVVRADGSQWLSTWRAVGNNIMEAPVCPHCPTCVKQERVEVPLTAAPPIVRGAFVSNSAVVPTTGGEGSE